MQEKILITAESVEHFLDQFATATLAGFKRTANLQISMSVMTNYWQCEMVRDTIVEDVERPTPPPLEMIEDEKPKGRKPRNTEAPQSKEN